MPEPAPDEPLKSQIARSELCLENLARLNRLICSICVDGEEVKLTDDQKEFLTIATRDQMLRLISIEASLQALLSCYAVDPH